MWPQILVLGFFLITLGMSIADHGKVKEVKELKPENAWVTLIAKLVVLFVLYQGGFFDCFFHAH